MVQSDVSMKIFITSLDRNNDVFASFFNLWPYVCIKHINYSLSNNQQAVYIIQQYFYFKIARLDKVYYHKTKLQVGRKKIYINKYNVVVKCLVIPVKFIVVSVLGTNNEICILFCLNCKQGCRKNNPCKVGHEPRTERQRQKPHQKITVHN